MSMNGEVQYELGTITVWTKRSVYRNHFASTVFHIFSYRRY
jgi:hypothetical protein